MMGGSETGSRDKDGVHSAAIHVPIGWQRRVEGVQVVYVSPNGTALSSLDEVKTYLLSDGTCKCGLECPLIIHKVFNFTVGVKVEQHNQPLSKAEQDMTKLCNHRRKVVAMAALCRSMQASQLPFANVHHPEPGIVVDSCNPKRTHIKGEEEGRGNCHSKPLPKPSWTQNNLHPNSVASPKSPQQFVYPYNGSSPGIHTDSHHPLEALKRLQHPPFSLPSSSSAGSSLPGYCISQRSPRHPPPQNVNQCHRTSKTPEIPSSPRLRLHPSPPPLSAGGGQPPPAHHPRGVIIGGSPSSRSPSLSPSVHKMNCASPHQRSRHPSSSPSPLSEHGGGSAPAMPGEGLLASNYRHRRKSTSSSPQSPRSCSSNPNFPKYKLEDVLDQFKNSGNISTSSHLLIPTNTFLTNQSSGNPHAISLKTLKSTVSPLPSTGPHGFVSNSIAACSSPLGPFQNHHSHQSKSPHPASFPASSLLSAAAKAQLANQLSQGEGPSLGNNQEDVSTSAEELREARQQQTTKVKNSTLYNSQLPSPIARTHHPSLASSVLFPTSQSTAPSLASTLPHLPPPTERSALHRKRQRRSPTTLTITRNTLANGTRKASPGSAASTSVINLSCSASPPLAHPSSTSDVPGQSPDTLESRSHSDRTPGLTNTRQAAHLPRHRQNEALDFTTRHHAIPLGLDPPTQPLSALLHLLSVQNAQASASNSSQEDGHGNKQSANSLSAPPLFKVRHQTRSLRQPGDTTPQCLVAPQTPSPAPELQSEPHQTNHFSPQHRRSPAYSNLALDCSTPTSRSVSENRRQTANHIPSRDPASQGHFENSVATGISRSGSPQYSQQSAQDSVSVALSTSPKPLDLSNHVLALLAASSAAPQEEGNSSGHVVDASMSSQRDPVPEDREGVDEKESKPPENTNSTLHENNSSPPTSSDMTESTTALHLAEAFPFMNQEQLLQLLSSTGGLPSILDPAVLASLHLGGLLLCGQHAQMSSNNSSPQSPQNIAEQPEHIVIQQQEQQNPDHQQKLLHNGSLFPLLPMLNNIHGELPLNLLGLLNPIPTPLSTSSAGQEGDLGLPEKQNLHALLMASLLLGQQQGPMLPLTGLSQLNQVSLEVPLQPPQHISALESLNFDKASGLLEPSALPGPGLLDLSPGLLPIPHGAEGSLQSLQSLLFPAALPHPATFLPLNPALLTAALNSAELHPPHSQLVSAQQTQHTQPQVHSEAGVDTLIPLSLQSKDNSILQQLLPSLLNPALLGDPSCLSGLHNLMGIGAGSILLPPNPALGMPLLQGPDGALNLLNNIQLNLSPAPEAEKNAALQETPSPNPHEDIPAIELSSEAVPSPASPPKHTPSPQQAAGGRAVIDPYTSFMDTIYTSFLQVNAKEEEDGGTGPSDPTSPFCALPPVPFPFKNHAPSTPAMPQASAPVSLSPRLACSLRNPDLSRLSLEAAAHSPAQGTPKPSEEGAITPLQRKQVIEEGHTHPDPPLPPMFFEEAKTDYAGPASAACPYVEADRQGQSGYLQPRDSCSGIPREEMSEMLLHRDQERDDVGAVGGARRGRKRKQTLQNVLEDFRDLDAATLEETKATAALLKPERSVRGRRRRGARSQRQ